MTSLLLDLIRGTLGALFIIYTVVAVTHYVLQLVISHRVWRQQRSAAFAAEHPPLDVAVDVIIPVYNEAADVLEGCVRSVLAQIHDGLLRIFVVDDGSPNRAALDPLYEQLEADGVIVVRSPRNIGKRHAQALVLPLGTAPIIVTVDSDTVLASDAVAMLTRQFDNPKTGAVTGFVSVTNRRDNVLTRIQYLRYWMAFNQERAAQSAYRTVLCCSGPLAAYRREIIEKVKDAYLTQSYGGVPCTFGDDRHLTNLVLNEGYDTLFDSEARCHTLVPDNIRQFLKQQLRWNKSFYRELIWTMPYIGTKPLWTQFDFACQVAMPVMLTVTASTALIIGIASSPLYLLHYAAVVAIAASIRATYGAIRMRDPGFYLFLVYGFVSAVVLLTVRLRALMTLTETLWGTRGPVVAANAATNAVFDGAWRAGLRLTTMQTAEPVRAQLDNGCLHAMASPNANFCKACGQRLN